MTLWSAYQRDRDCTISRCGMQCSEIFFAYCVYCVCILLLFFQNVKINGGGRRKGEILNINTVKTLFFFHLQKEEHFIWGENILLLLHTIY